jgi:hypothetical protein
MSKRLYVKNRSKYELKRLEREKEHQYELMEAKHRYDVQKIKM